MATTTTTTTRAPTTTPAPPLPTTIEMVVDVRENFYVPVSIPTPEYIPSPTRPSIPVPAPAGSCKDVVINCEDIVSLCPTDKKLREELCFKSCGGCGGSIPVQPVMPVKPITPVLPPQDLLPKFEQSMNLPQFSSYQPPAPKPVQVQPQIPPVQALPQPIRTAVSSSGCIDSAPECKLITFEMCQQVGLKK